MHVQNRFDAEGYFMMHTIRTIHFLAFCTCMLLPQLAARAQLPYQETDIPVRDGKTLRADMYIGDGIGKKPVILVQTPYNRLLYRVSLGRKGSHFPLDTSAYHYVFVDWRGFYGSAAAAVAGYDRGLDGYDIVEWLAVQSFSNGKIATFGGSALGMIQFQTARHKPPHLVCAAPSIIDYRTEYSDYYCQGVLRHEHVQSLERLGFTSSDLITSRPVENALWDVIRNQSDYPEDIAIPLLMCSGWFDHYPADVLRAFADLRSRSDAGVRAQHKLIMGPWTHSEVDLEIQGDLRFPEAVDVYRDAALQFFAYHLLGAKNGWPLQPALRYFQMGENTWKTADSWDSRPGIPYILHLHSDGSMDEHMETAIGTRSMPYDPRDPSPSFGGARFNPLDPTAIAGPLDISATVEARQDVLIFTSSELRSDIRTAGPAQVTVTLSSNRTDTDVSVRLCDVYPDGSSIILGDGIRRLRFRGGTRSEVLMQPGTPYTTTVTLPDFAHTFLPGHRIRVVLASSNWPRFDRNLNNGGTMYSAGDTLLAENTLHFGPGYKAELRLELSSPLSSIQSTTVPANIGILHLYPQPLNPSGELLQIDLAPASSAASVSILDALGRQVCQLPLPTEGHRRLTWDGRDASGRLVAAGCYFIRMTDRGSVYHKPLLVVR
jgi:uncharacterized protein